MATLERAIAIAAEAHAGQVDRAGEPYILHPLRVMMRLDVKTDEARIVAVLHDVVEDCPEWSLSRLQDIEGFSPAIVSAIDGVTRRKDETYSDFIARARLGNISREVKRCDLLDNMATERLRRLPLADAERLHRKYFEALVAL